MALGTAFLVALNLELRSLALDISQYILVLFRKALAKSGFFKLKGPSTQIQVSAQDHIHDA